MCLRQAQTSIFGAFDKLRHQFSVPSTGSGTESSSKYKAVIEGGEITEMMSENVPSTGSGTGSSNKYKTVIERSRNHREDENKNVPSTGSGTGSSNKYNTVIERSRNHREYE